MTDPRQGIIFGVERNDSSAAAMRKADFQRSYDTVGLALDLVAIGSDSFEKFADVVVRTMLFKSQFWFGPNLRIRTKCISIQSIHKTANVVCLPSG